MASLCRVHTITDPGCPTRATLTPVLPWSHHWGHFCLSVGETSLNLARIVP